MYMPGRLRTASRPSRTVMSLAPYDSAPSRLLMRGGSCRHTPTGAENCWSEGRSDVGEQRRSGGGDHQITMMKVYQLAVTISAGPRGRSGPKPEANALHLRASRQGFESSAQLGFEPPQLAHPCRVVDLDDELAVTERNGLRMGRELGARERWPLGEHGLDRPRSGRAQ